MESKISSSLISCLQTFNKLIRHSNIEKTDDLPAILWKDELGRLRVWGANIAAHQSGQSSLDYRLRDASHIRDQIIDILGDLQRLLQDADELLGEKPSFAVAITDDGADPSAADCIEPTDEEEESELQQIYREVKDAVNCLFKMSMLIRNPARHDRVIGSRKVETVGFEPFDRDHVSHKFPKADQLIVDRLGLAITRRRQDLKYRERHHAKLSQGITHEHDTLSDQKENTSTVMSPTIATELEAPNIDFDDVISNSDLSQTSYTASIEGSGRISVPPPPKESSNEQPFQCPFCYFVITIKNRRAWTRHVFKDIMPYSCVFPQCHTASKLYDSRRNWFHHEMTVHIQSAYEQNSNVVCPLCLQIDISKQRIEQHLARHLEELALFAMPYPEIDEDDSSGGSRSERDNASSGSDSETEKALNKQRDSSENDPLDLDVEDDNVRRMATENDLRQDQVEAYPTYRTPKEVIEALIKLESDLNNFAMNPIDTSALLHAQNVVDKARSYMEYELSYPFRRHEILEHLRVILRKLDKEGWSNIKGIREESSAVSEAMADMTSHCGVESSDGSHCHNCLHCTVHDEVAKRAVRGRNAPYEILLQEHEAEHCSKTDDSRQGFRFSDPVEYEKMIKREEKLPYPDEYERMIKREKEGEAKDYLRENVLQEREDDLRRRQSSFMELEREKQLRDDRERLNALDSIAKKTYPTEREERKKEVEADFREKRLQEREENLRRPEFEIMENHTSLKKKRALLRDARESQKSWEQKSAAKSGTIERQVLGKKSTESS
ncbi:MAG: hypothetical protein Q9227_003639 [Pyrenula ochraceoflavens]